jgi:hypothetical protein
LFCFFDTDQVLKEEIRKKSIDLPPLEKLVLRVFWQVGYPSG